MKLLRHLLYCILFVVLVSQNSFAKNDEPLNPKHKIVNVIDSKSNVKSYLSGKLSKESKIMAGGLNWTVIDSTANGFSMLEYDLLPFFYEPITNTTLLLTRGSHEVTDDGYSPENSKNNLFLKVSKDLGASWLPRVTAYNAENNSGGTNDAARYPSLFVYPNQPSNPSSTLQILFSGSLINYTDLTTWTGIMTGAITPDNGGIANSLEDAGFFPINSIKYRFGLYQYNGNTGVKGWNSGTYGLVGFTSGTSPNTTIHNMLATEICPFPSGSLNNNNNICLVDAQDLIGNYSIPPQWASKNFPNVDSTFFRNRTVNKIIKDIDGKIYSTVTARWLKAGVDSNAWFPGVSSSSDNGKTWSEFEVFPRAYIDDYVQNKLGSGFTPSDFVITLRENIAFVPFTNGDYSYFVVLVEDSTSNTKTTTELDKRVRQIVELYKEKGEFGVRFVADSIRPYGNALNDGSSNVVSPTYHELQASKTFDEGRIVVKWNHNFTSYMYESGTSVYYSNYWADIIIKGREKEAKSFVRKMNLTNQESVNTDSLRSNFINKMTWIPNILPNDLKHIPIIRCRTTNGDDITNQRLYASRQYIDGSYFDAYGVTAVEDNNQIEITNIKIDNVFPNPTNKELNLNYSIKSDDNVSFEITNALGQVFAKIDKGFVTFGAHNVSIDIDALQNGNYFVTLISNKQRSTSKFTVVK